MNILDDKFAIIFKNICLTFVVLCLSACEESRYDIAFNELMLHEGGYVNHPDDPGGETKYGICKKYNPEIDIKNITLEYAKNYYYKNFWTSMYDKIHNPEVAIKLFDVSVNIGKPKMRALVNATLMDSLCYPNEHLITELNRAVDAYENNNDVRSWEKFGIVLLLRSH